MFLSSLWHLNFRHERHEDSRSSVRFATRTSQYSMPSSAMRWRFLLIFGENIAPWSWQYMQSHARDAPGHRRPAA
jgi:hypothetical protein